MAGFWVDLEKHISQQNFLLGFSQFEAGACFPHCFSYMGVETQHVLNGNLLCSYDLWVLWETLNKIYNHDDPAMSSWQLDHDDTLTKRTCANKFFFLNHSHVLGPWMHTGSVYLSLISIFWLIWLSILIGMRLNKSLQSHPADNQQDGESEELKMKVSQI